MVTQNKQAKTILFLFGIILFTNLVLAFGAINYPGEILEREMHLIPGEERQVMFKIQSAETGTINVKVEVQAGNEIITLNGEDTYAVQQGQKIPVTFDIKIPSNDRPGKTYPVEIVFSKAGDGSGTVGLGGSIKTTFNAMVVEDPDKTISTSMILLLLIIAIIILAAIIYYLVRRSKK